jgi:hypothetical protein
MLKLLTFAAAAALAAAPLVAQAGPSSTCFRLSDIQSTRLTHGDHTLYLRASTGAYYRMEFASACQNPTNETLILHPTSNSGEVCGAIGLDVRVRDGAGCIPSNLSRMTPDEVAAIPAGERP